ncbi:hypothetical protein BN2497_5215 [Janthinobacterium sp. CG23_2]|nr:hypothetical protein BN2497_5215 [Janthinobacterium sp. CG23_2]CUU29005.1 hypothetical protein BN3177_5215 [Janthinobacterium sp. CG23_2]
MHHDVLRHAIDDENTLSVANISFGAGLPDSLEAGGFDSLGHIDSHDARVGVCGDARSDRSARASGAYQKGSGKR